MTQEVKNVNLTIVDLVMDKGEVVDFEDGTGPYQVEPSYRMVIQVAPAVYRDVAIPSETFEEICSIL